MWETLFFVLIYGFVMGAIYLLIALGFSLICGVLRIFHLGYAYIFPLTIYGTWMFMREWGFGLIPAIAGMVIVQFAIGIFIYRFLIRKYIADEMTLLTALLLIALIVEQAVSWRYPIQEAVYLPTTLVDGVVELGAAVIPAQLVIAAFIGLALTALFVLFFVKTKEGLAIRALSQSIESSRFIGIKVESLYIFVTMIVLIPVIIAMLMVSPVWMIEPAMGWNCMIIAILIAVLGGLGNIKGTIIASFLIGITHAVMCFVVGEPRFMNLAALLLVMVILVIRPQGLARSETLW
ncbi:MAG: branched-chain amino acid ABC transporter permease [Desulfobacteraceae bacterium]|nr:MAG: branched-chain amino acid ABC transporter permease [Desulfobacteraceae bacterium]